MKNALPVLIARTAFRAGSLRGLCLIKWNSGPQLVACFGDQWRADWFTCRWQRAGATQFVSKHGSVCVAVPVNAAINFPFQNAGLPFGPSDQWRKWDVAGGIKHLIVPSAILAKSNPAGGGRNVYSRARLSNRVVVNRETGTQVGTLCTCLPIYASAQGYFGLHIRIDYCRPPTA